MPAFVGSRRTLLSRPRQIAAGPAAPIGTPLAQAYGGSGGGVSASYTLTPTAADTPAGAHLIVFVGISNSNTLNSISDGVNGTTGWTLGPPVSLGGGTFVLCHRQQGGSALPAGTVITVTHASATGNKTGIAFSVTGLDNAALIDLAMAGTSATSYTPSFTSGTFNSASVLAMGFVFRAAATGDAYTAVSPFTGLSSASAGAGSADLHADYSIRSTTAAVTLAPTVPGSPATQRLWMALIVGLKGL